MASRSQVFGQEISKEAIRKQVWDYLEHNDLSLFPRPVYGRIPNFKGCEAAAQKFSEMDVFRSASLIKVGPDSPQQGIRRLALECNKQVVMPIPRLRSGLFVRLDPHLLPRHKAKYASTAKGAKELGKPVGLDVVLPIDVLVMGSVAVSPQGYRIGKGEGFADLEYGILKEMGSIDDSVPLVTSVHDCQVFEELPKELFKEYDMPVDIIVTPTRIIHTSARASSLPRPSGIIWELLTPKRISEMPILRILRERLIAQGKNCSLRND